MVKRRRQGGLGRDLEHEVSDRLHGESLTDSAEIVLNLRTSVRGPRSGWTDGEARETGESRRLTSAASTLRFLSYIAAAFFATNTMGLSFSRLCACTCSL